jgi:hypothetical protein
MDSQFFKTSQWRSAAPQARHSRLASFNSMVVFVVDQILLFWPPYRYEKDCASRQSGESPNDQDDPPS